MRILCIHSPSNSSTSTLKEALPVLAQLTITDSFSEALVYLDMVDFTIVLIAATHPDATLQFCQTLRRTAYTASILVLTEVDQPLLTRQLLESGADDVITTPVDTTVLKAKMLALARRSALPLHEPLLKVGGLTLDLVTAQVAYLNQPIHLRRKELLLLAYLMKHPHQILTRERLFDHIWGVDSPSDLHTVDVHIQALRQKIDHRFALELIKTSYGLGYKLVCPTPANVLK